MIVNASALKIPVRTYEAKLIYCDPPRNMGMNEHNSDDKLDPFEYEEFTIQWIKEAYRCMRVEGWLVICTWHCQRYFFEHLLRTNYPYLEYDHEIIWDYNFGLYTHDRFVPSHDNILVFKRGHPQFHWQSVAVRSQRQDAGDTRADYRGRTPSSVWPIPRVPGNSKARSFMTDTHRRTCQPLELCTRVVKAFTDPNDLVLDLFSGAGTMGLATRTAERQYFGLDICEHYCKEARRRLDLEHERLFIKG